MLHFFSKSESLGHNHKAGDRHYRAYVGPPGRYDIIAAMSFNLLTCCGLRQHHNLLDVGCGSLRLGRIVIPYLNSGKYIGVEPNKWLIDEAIKRETGKTLIKIKKPKFIIDDSISSHNIPQFNFAIAQSIFSHTKLSLFKQWMTELTNNISDDGCIFATFILGNEDEQVAGKWEGTGDWVYPNCIRFKESTIKDIANAHNLNSMRLNYWHPTQTWFAFYNNSFNAELFAKGQITWNNLQSQQQ